MQNSPDVHQLPTEWGCSLWLSPELWIKPINPFSVTARVSHRTTTNVSLQKLQILCSFIILRYYKKKKLWKNGLSKKLTSSFTRWWSKGDGLSSCDWLGELAGVLKTCEMCWCSCSICSWTSCFLLLLLLQVSVWVLLTTWKHCANSTFCPLFLVISRLLSKFCFIFSSIRFFSYTVRSTSRVLSCLVLNF